MMTTRDSMRTGFSQIKKKSVDARFRASLLLESLLYPELNGAPFCYILVAFCAILVSGYTSITRYPLLKRLCSGKERAWRAREGEMESAHCAVVEVDEWDADGFEIPSLKLVNCNSVKEDALGANSPPSSSQKIVTINEKIYLGPHWAPPSQVKQQEPKTAGKKQGHKQKPIEGDKRGSPWVTRMK